MKRRLVSIVLLLTLLSIGGLRPEIAFAASTKSVYLTTADGLTVSSNLGITGANITIETWVNIRTAPTAGSFREIAIFFRGATSPYKVWEIAYLDSAGTKKLSFQQGRICVGNDYRQVNYDLGTNTWHHVAMTDDGTTVRGYVDGVEVVNGASGGAGSSCGSDEFNINDLYYEDFTTHRLDAYYDEFRVWDVVRTQPEIDSAKCTTLTSTTNLRASYLFDADAATDSSGNGYTLSALHGSSSLVSDVPTCLASATPKSRPIILVQILNGFARPEDIS